MYIDSLTEIQKVALDIENKRRITYMEMRIARRLSNTENQDREYWLNVLETHRKTLGNFHYVPPPAEIAHKSDLVSEHKLAEVFKHCPQCLRLLHYSVIGTVCYSCATA